MFLLFANILSDFQRSLRFNSLTHSLRFNLLQAELLWGNTCKNMCLHYIWFLHFNMIKTTEVFLIKNKDISYLVNTLAADGLVMTYQLVSPKPLTWPFVLKYVKLLGLPTRHHSHQARLPGESHMSEHPLFSPVASQWLCNQMQSAWDVAAVRLLTF